jgi:hypothetical protein
MTPRRFQEFWVLQRKGNAWHIADIERSHISTRLTTPNHVEGFAEEQLEELVRDQRCDLTSESSRGS